MAPHLSDHLSSLCHIGGECARVAWHIVHLSVACHADRCRSLQRHPSTLKFSVQVVSAKGLRAADSNGLSDPYTVVHLGSRTDQTRVIQENLNPEWHETFVYSAEDIQSALMDHMSSILFEVWDSDFGLIADDFLGQVSACHVQFCVM